MRARIVKIGNSKGIRIPKPVLKQSGITEDVDLEVQDNQILIRPLSKPRSRWDKAFRKMAEKGDDMLIDAGEPI